MNRQTSVAVTAFTSLIASAAHADTVDWIATHGAYHTDWVWSTGAVPDSNDRAVFDLAGGHDVLFGVQTWCHEFRIGDGIWTFALADVPVNLTSLSYTDVDTAALQVGTAAGDVSTLFVQDGGSLSGARLVAGGDAGSSAFITVRGESIFSFERVDMSWNGGTSAWFVTEDASVHSETTWLGSIGSSTLGIEGGSTVDLGATRLGLELDGDAEINVGNGTLLTSWMTAGDFGDAVINVDGAAASWINAGDALLAADGGCDADVRNGGNATIDGKLAVGAWTNGDGVLEIGAAGTGTVDVAGDVEVGGYIGVPGGTGEIVIHPGGLLDGGAAHEIYVGGATRLLGGELRAAWLRYAGSAGTFQWTDGTVRLSASAEVTSTNPLGRFRTLGPTQALHTDRLFVYEDDLAYIDADGGLIHANVAQYGGPAGQRGETYVNAGGTYIIDNAVAIGGTLESNGGTGELRVIDGSAAIGQAALVWTDGVIDVQGGSMTSPIVDVVGGVARQSGGTFIVSNDLTTAEPGGLTVDGSALSWLRVRQMGTLQTPFGRIGTVGGGRGLVELYGVDAWWHTSDVIVGTDDGSAVEARLEIRLGGVLDCQILGVHADGDLILDEGNVIGDVICAGAFAARGSLEDDLTLEPTATTTMSLFGDGFFADALSVGGTATLGGTLELNADGYVPNLADSFTLIETNGIVGEFDHVEANGFGTLAPIVEIVGDDVVVTFTLRADLDRNGVVDVADMLHLIGQWGSCTDCDADINVDGVVDVADLLEVLAAWS